MQPTHSVHVLGGARFAGPRTKPNGVVHANGCEKESEEESRQEEDEEGEKEEIRNVDHLNVVARGGQGLVTEASRRQRRQGPRLESPKRFISRGRAHQELCGKPRSGAVLFCPLAEAFGLNPAPKIVLVRCTNSKQCMKIRVNGLNSAFTCPPPRSHQRRKRN